MHDDIDSWLDVMAEAIREHVGVVFAPVLARVAALEAREPPQGLPGERGADGRDGIDGKDGKEGSKGRDGIDGKDGKDGAAGLDGKDGGRGADGRDGRDGKDGRDGADGKDGADGQDGADGRDASDLDVLPMIDFARSYARGTLAQHNGGLWRAYTNTDGEHGWGCIVEGLAGITVGQEGERGVVVSVLSSSGRIERCVFHFPVLIYREVYVAGRQYEAGDTVTWAGSLWHCNEATDAKPDADGRAWTLAAKRGRDGRDGRDVNGVKVLP